MITRIKWACLIMFDLYKARYLSMLDISSDCHPISISYINAYTPVYKDTLPMYLFFLFDHTYLRIGIA